jgi:hypothetical protein
MNMKKYRVFFKGMPGAPVLPWRDLEAPSESAARLLASHERQVQGFPADVESVQFLGGEA